MYCDGECGHKVYAQLHTHHQTGCSKLTCRFRPSPRASPCARRRVERRWLTGKSIFRYPPALTPYTSHTSYAAFHRVQPSSTEFHRVPPSSTEFHRVPPSSTEFHRVPPSSTEFNRVQPSSTKSTQCWEVKFKPERRFKFPIRYHQNCTLQYPC